MCEGLYSEVETKVVMNGENQDDLMLGVIQGYVYPFSHFY